MQTKGTVTMEHMEMLLNAGIPAIEMYADAIGVTAADVTDMMSSGELSASSFINTMNLAISSGTARFPSLSGAAKEAGASWGATFDNMGAAVTRGVQSIITSIDETQEALGRPTMRDAVKTFGSMFEDALKLVAAVLPPVIENVDLLTIGVGGLLCTRPMQCTKPPPAGQTGSSMGKLRPFSLCQVFCHQSQCRSVIAQLPGRAH